MPRPKTKTTPAPKYKGLPPPEPPTWGNLGLIVLLTAVFTAYLGYWGLMSEANPAETYPSKVPVPELEVMRIPSPAKQSASIIFLHGLGDTGAGWQFLAETMHQAPHFSHVGFVFPTAPVRPVTAYDQNTTAWFNVISEKERCDRVSLQQSLVGLRKVIEGEIAKGIPADRIVLGGFSQGGALVQASAVNLKHKLGGFVSISGYLPRPQDLEPSKVNQKTPFLIQHGDSDDVIDIEMDRQGIAKLKEFGFKPRFKKYPGVAHTLALEEMEDLMKFLERTTRPPNAAFA